MKKSLILFVALAALIAIVAGCGSSPGTPGGRRAGGWVFNPRPYTSPYGRDATGYNGVVASAKPEASDIGLDILLRGGNAVDAAIAVGFALGVAEPNANGLGGGGFMMIKLVDMDEAVFIDFREIAPGNSTTSMYLGPDGNTVMFPGTNSRTHVVGGLAAGTPGEVAGLLYALENYGSGRFSRRDLIQPSIDLARNGFIVTESFHGAIVDNIDKINRFPATAEIYTDFGLPWEVGDILRNPDLAYTLDLIAQYGYDGFYRGPVAEAIVSAVAEAGGIITLSDLANYQTQGLRVSAPVTGTYRDHIIISAPPPSSGGTHVIQILNMLENMDRSELVHGDPRAVNAWIHALRFAFADRGAYMADTQFANVPLVGLSNKVYARELFELFDLDTALISATANDPFRYESGSTTSYSIIDSAGNIVTVTKTINYFFGGGVGVPGFGFIMNNEMDDFVPNNPNHPNAPEPFKKPLSSMTPTIVLDPQGRPFLTLGSPGATRIIGTMAQVISNVIDNNMSLQEAIDVPRWFTMASGAVSLEGRHPDSLAEALRTLGYDVQIRLPWDAWFGGVHGVLLDHNTGRMYGAADSRRDGQARAY